MHDIELETPPAPAPPRHSHRRRWLVAGLAVLLVLVGTGATMWWLATRPPAPVSVSDVVDRYRNTDPDQSTSVGGPAPGVYVYATHGTERISVGDVTHQYPRRTTLTVTRSECGIDARWDALSGRYGIWNFCKTAAGWRLVHYVDVHKFLYMKDVHDYTCSGFPTVVCRAKDGVLTSTLTTVGTESLDLDGATVSTTHLRIDQKATGKSVSEGTVDLWVLPNGLPVRAQVDDHGSSVVLGSHVDYFESAAFRLTSQTPRR